MDRAFFRSREFLVAGIVVCVLAAGAFAAIASASWSFDSSVREACAPPLLSGTPIEVEPETTDAESARISAYSLDASAFEGGLLDLCTSVGDVEVMPSEDGNVTLVATVRARGPGADAAVDATRFDVRFAESEGRLHAFVWQTTSGRSSWFGGSTTPHLDLELRVPASGAYVARLHTDVGDVDLGALLLESLDVHTDVGDVRVRGGDLLSNADFHTDVGDVSATFASVSSGSIRIRTDVGEAVLTLPVRPDVGYDVQATADVGDIAIEIGDTEVRERDDDGPGGDAHHRSRGFAERPSKVRVVVSTDVGDIVVRTQ